MSSKRIRVAISHGDMNGISYEIMLKAFKEEAILDLFTPVIYGSSRIANYWKQRLGIGSPTWQQISSAKEVKDGQVNIINCVDNDCVVEIGVPTDISGKMAFLSLQAATNDVTAGLCDVLVTAPISKYSMPKDDFPFKGHTDYLQAKCSNGVDKSMMILACSNVRVALATTHCPLKDVSSLITKELLVERIKTFDYALRRDFNITKPRIAVLGLNPHSGDNGLIGKEEKEVIIPAINEADQNRYIVFGPYPADGFFGSDTMDKFDGILAMYHDQGLAPFKALYMNRGVNFTAGIDIIRTSPDHGTGFDIAGKGCANEESFREAIYLAIDTYRSRQFFNEANRNPLRRTYVIGRRDDNIDITKYEY